MVAVGWTRTNDLLVMSQTSYQLLHPAWCQWLGSNQRPHPYEGCVLNLLNYTGK